MFRRIMQKIALALARSNLLQAENAYWRLLNGSNTVYGDPIAETVFTGLIRYRLRYERCRAQYQRILKQTPPPSKV